MPNIVWGTYHRGNMRKIAHICRMTLLNMC